MGNCGTASTRIRTVDRVGDGRVLKGDGVDRVVVASTDAADGQTVSTRAGTAAERDGGTRIDGNAVVLVVDLSASDDHIGALANVEAICVVTTRIVTGGVVNGHVGDGQPIATVDTDGLDGGVLNVEVLDGRVGQIVGVEELGLGNAAVGALTIPPAGSVGVQLGPIGAPDGDAVALDLEQRSIPLLVLPRGGALEDDLKWG